MLCYSKALAIALVWNLLNFKVVGVDVSQHMIDVAQEKKIPNAVFLKYDLTKLQTQIWEQRFDLVTTFWVMQVCM